MTSARPILFSPPMVRALLEGRKTQTRRLLKPQPPADYRVVWHEPLGAHVGFSRSDENYSPRIPYGVPGDLLWVRETWCHTGTGVWKASDHYLATDGKVIYRADASDGSGWWFSSLHMPRRLSRLTLELTDMKVERLQDISEADAKAEGAMYHDGCGIGHSGWRHDFKDVHANCRSSYARLWNDINGPGAWNANPWVVALTFTVHKQNVDAVLASRNPPGNVMAAQAATHGNAHEATP